MGRSRITRTFHNKPVSKPKKGPVGKPKNTVVQPAKTTYTRGKRIDPRPINTEKSKPRGPEKVKNNTTQRGNLLPQAHAQESKPISVNPQGKYGTIDSTEDQIIGEKWGSFQFTIDKTGKPRGRNVKIRTTTRTDGVADTTVASKYTTTDTEKFTKKRTILGKFAQGVSNEAQDMVGIPHGFITGNNYKPKSILSRATEHVLAGDWGSAGSVISNNPYRFAGNIATTVGTSFIPFGAVTRGAGLAARVGSVVTKGKSNIAGKLKGKGAEKKSYAGGKYTNKEINDTERLVQQSEWMGWGKSGKGGIKYPKTDNAGNKVSKKEWIRREKAADADLLRSDIRAGLRDSPGTVIPGRGVIGKDGISVIPFRKGIVGKAKSKVSKLRTSYRYANPDKKTFEGKVGRAKMLPQKIRDKKGDIDLKIKKKTYYKGFTQLHGRRRESINNPDYWGGPYSSRGGSLRAADRDIWEVNRFNKGSFRQQKPKSGVAFIPTTVPKYVGIGYDEYY